MGREERLSRVFVHLRTRWFRASTWSSSCTCSSGVALVHVPPTPSRRLAELQRRPGPPGSGSPTYLSDAPGDLIEGILPADSLTSGPDGVDKRRRGRRGPTLHCRAAAGSAGSACRSAFSSGAGGLSGRAGQRCPFPG